MERSEPTESTAARATGALFFIGFGTLWLCTGLSTLGRLNAVSGAGVAVILLALIIPAVRLLRRASNPSRADTESEEQARVKRIFRWVNIVQWIGVGAAALLLGMFHLLQYIVPAIATIVGLHLFPLASAFRYPVHYVTGSLLVVWSAGAVLALPKERIPSVGALGTAAILLLSAAYTLMIASRAARKPAPGCA